MTTQTLTAPAAGWLRNAPFDLTLIVGVAALALLSGAIVTVEPTLFPIILFLDLWLLGYHHVVSTFTRLAFDRESFREHRALVTWVPIVVVAGVLAAGIASGGWVLATTYLYWQFFHYTRQSYGLERAYRRKSGGAITGDERLTRWALYLLPLWGILYRSYQQPETFLSMELKVLPVPRPLLLAVAALAILSLSAWLTRFVLAIARGERPTAHSLYLLSHFVIFAVGYLLIADLDHGWLVLNVWHNAQYILFVWMFNNNRFSEGISPKARLLSYLSQRSHWPVYAVVSLGISSILYFGLESVVAALDGGTALPLFLICYMAINFHHYVVDGMIWKLRKKKISETLHLDEAAGAVTPR